MKTNLKTILINIFSVLLLLVTAYFYLRGYTHDMVFFGILYIWTLIPNVVITITEDK